MQTLTVTTSWDDGHVLDLRVAEILDHHGMVGTFYIARDFLDKRMSVAQIRDLAQHHEIGAHTLTHPTLTTIPLDNATTEIIESKKWLEDVLGQPVNSFCYPRGYHNQALQTIVREAGYTQARTVEAFKITAGDNPHAVPTTLQIYPYPLRPMPTVPLYRGWGARLQPLISAWQNHPNKQLTQFMSWEQYILSWATYSADNDGVFHLWGHSWEVDKFALWQRLDQTLATLAQHFKIVPLTNDKLV